MRHTQLFFCFLVLFFALSRIPFEAVGDSSFPNGGFEAGGSGKPSDWTWPTHDWVWDATTAHSGVYSARVSKSNPNIASDELWSANVPVQPSTAYTLTFWLRIENATARPTVAVHQYTSANLQTGLRQVALEDLGNGTKGWTPVLLHFQTMPNAHHVRIRVYLWTTANGTFWFDDFALDQGSTARFPFHSGWPVQLEGLVNLSSPAIADVNRDGRSEIFVGDNLGKVYGWNGAGTPLSGFPINTNDGSIYGPLALADLDGDGNLEIIAGTRAATQGGPGHVFIWRPTGQPYPGWPQAVAWNTIGSSGISEVRSVAVADIDGDGILDILAGTTNNAANYSGSNPPPTYNVYAWHRDGTLMAGMWPTWASTAAWKSTAGIFGAIAVGDLDRNGISNVVTGRDHSWLYAYSPTGSHLSHWPVPAFVSSTGDWNTDPRIEFGFSAPILVDLEGNGSLEYVAAGVVVASDTKHWTNNALVVYEPDGTRPNAWDQAALGTGMLYPNQLPQESPTVADLDNDGRLEIILATFDGWIRAYKYDKAPLWAFNYAQGQTVFASEPAIGDIDGDGSLEVVFNTYDPRLAGATVGTWALKNDGSVVNGFPLYIGAGGASAAPTLADLDGDGQLEIAVATRSYEYAVYVWDTPAPYIPYRLPWPMSRQNLRRTATFTPLQPNYDASTKTASDPAPKLGDVFTFTISLVNSGSPLTSTLSVTDVIPSALAYVSGTLKSSIGDATISGGNTINWSGIPNDERAITINYAARVDVDMRQVIQNTAVIESAATGSISRTATIIANGFKTHLPMISRP